MVKTKEEIKAEFLRKFRELWEERMKELYPDENNRMGPNITALAEAFAESHAIAVMQLQELIEGK